MENKNRDYAQSVTNTILEQLGGDEFKRMTGAKNFSYGVADLSLNFEIRKNPRGITHLKIKYLEGEDTYQVNFLVNDKDLGIILVKRRECYCDGLGDVISDHTGLDTPAVEFGCSCDFEGAYI